MSKNSPAAGRPDPGRIRGGADFAAVFGVSHETIARLEAYAALLRRWQGAVNLVAGDTLDDVWHRHFADSAQLLALAPDARRWLDLGSGAGFPGLVIAVLLANRNGVMVHLVESNARKCAFLREAARATGASVTIHAARIESLAPGDDLPAPDIVTARALAPLDKLLGLSTHAFAPHSRALFLKGRRAETELAAARAHWRFEARLHASRTDRDGRIVDMRNIAGRARGGSA